MTWWKRTWQPSTGSSPSWEVKLADDSPIKKDFDTTREFLNDRKTREQAVLMEKWNPRFKEFYHGSIVVKRLIDAVVTLKDRTRLKRGSTPGRARTCNHCVRMQYSIQLSYGRKGLIHPISPAPTDKASSAIRRKRRPPIVPAARHTNRPGHRRASPKSA